jgi:hypothetical protein
MGIHNFHKWLTGKYPQSKINKQDLTGQCENMFIDLNFLLHYCSYGINIGDEHTLFHRITNNITFLINMFKPKNSVTLVTDGSPPLAKLITQRKRRILMSRKDEMECIDQLKLTVGTQFMESLSKKLHNYIENTKKKYNINITTIFHQPNEAEINIIHKINNKEPNEKNIIISNDADFIVLSCATFNNKNIYVVNINPGKKIIVYSIGKILELFINEYKGNNLDFVFMMLLMGNDYLPKVYYISFDILLKSFNKGKSLINIIDNLCVFNNKNLINYFINLISYIPKQMLYRYKLGNYNHHKIKYYLEGLNWCITNYSTGTCLKYDYMYTHGSIDPFDILYFLEFNTKININYPHPPFPSIDKDIYPILILPKKAISLINPKYHNLIKNEPKIQFLYEEEECDICKELHIDIGNIHKNIKNIQLNVQLEAESKDMEIDEEYLADLILPYKKKLGNLGSRFEKHKLSHKPINLIDIYNAIDIIKTSV